MVATMLGAWAVEGAAVALLRLLLLLLLPALRGPGLGVVGSAGAGLPESVIWAVNAGGEAHVDVHGIHFRKDPLEGRVGRGESPSAEPRDPGPAVLGSAGLGLRALSPLLDPGATSLEPSLSLQFPQGPGPSSEPSAGSKLRRAIEAELARSYIWTSHPAFLNPWLPPDGVM